MENVYSKTYLHKQESLKENSSRLKRDMINRFHMKGIKFSEGRITMKMKANIFQNNYIVFVNFIQNGI